MFPPKVWLQILISKGTVLGGGDLGGDSVMRAEPEQKRTERDTLCFSPRGDAKQEPTVKQEGALPRLNLPGP